MSETAHMRNLLNKAHTQSHQVQNTKLKTRPRYGVKGAALQVVDSFLELFLEAYSGQPEIHGPVWAEYSTYADDPEIVFKSANLNVDVDSIKFQGDFFNTFPDVFIVIKITNQQEHDPKFSLDAIYEHDEEDLEDMGEICMEIFAPVGTTPGQCIDFLSEHRLEICGILSHEFQHVVQKLAYEEKLTGSAANEVMLHAFDSNEIDARVEETLTLMGDDTPDEDESAFRITMSKYIDTYLARNIPADMGEQSLKDLKNQLMTVHTDAYKRKLGAVS